MELDQVDPDDGDQVAALVELSNAAAAVDDPDPWPEQPEIMVGHLRYGYDLHPRDFYLARPDASSGPVALVTIEMPTRDNLRLLVAEIIVHPDHRRRGYGTQLAAEIVRRAEAAGRSTIWLWARSGDPAAAAFADRLGFRAASQDARRRQTLSAVDEPTIDRLYVQARAASSDYVVERLPQPVGDQLLAELLAVTAAINDAPMGTLEFEDELFDVARLRDMETAWRGKGMRPYRVIARHRKTGEVAGHTLVMLHPSDPTHAFQGDTTVAREHRGHKLGLLLKIEAMRWLAEAEPQIEVIETWNNVDNTFMINVNEALGYQLSMLNTTYELISTAN